MGHRLFYRPIGGRDMNGSYRYYPAEAAANTAACPGLVERPAVPDLADARIRVMDHPETGLPVAAILVGVEPMGD